MSFIDNIVNECDIALKTLSNGVLEIEKDGISLTRIENN